MERKEHIMNTPGTVTGYEGRINNSIRRINVNNLDGVKEKSTAEIAPMVRYFESQREEYLELIHLLNETAKAVLNEQQSPGAFNLGFIQFVMEVNYKAYTAGLYRKV